MNSNKTTTTTNSNNKFLRCFGSACILVKIASPTEKSSPLKIFEKLSKYEDLKIEISKIWMKFQVFLKI